LKGDGKDLNINIVMTDISKYMEHDECVGECDAEMTLNNQKFS